MALTLRTIDPRRRVQWEVEALEPAELRRLVALAAFLDGWGAAGGGAPS